MIEKITNSLSEIDTKELRELQKKIDNIIETRNRKEKEKAWNEVVKAIKNYCSFFGPSGETFGYAVCREKDMGVEMDMIQHYLSAALDN